MIFESATPLARACDALVRARRERDIEAFESATAQLWEAAQTAPADELTTALTACAELLGELGPGFGGEFAVLCGALIELGAAPDPLVPVLRERLTEVAGLAAEFAEVWAREFPGEGTPSPTPRSSRPRWSASTRPSRRTRRCGSPRAGSGCSPGCAAPPRCCRSRPRRAGPARPNRRCGRRWPRWNPSARTWAGWPCCWRCSTGSGCWCCTGPPGAAGG
ncbi:hypothetical protein ACFQZ4_15290 [Catellatospora coxensis]